MYQSTVLITGGHPTPALAVIDELQAKYPDTSVIFAGRLHAHAKERDTSFEYQEVKRRGIPFISVTAFRGVWGTLLLPVSFCKALVLLLRVKPQVVLSFGGYVSVPIGLAAFFLRIPLILHEQTIHPGTANRLLGKIATDIFVAFPQAAAYFIPSKTQTIGNPIRQEILTPPTRNSFAALTDPVVFVTGGNLGSHAINSMIFSLLPTLTDSFTIIHQLGNITEFSDTEQAQKLLQALPHNKKARYLPVTHLSTQEMADALHRALFVICRSGANTVFELMALRKPAILIPLPWASFNEQALQAQILADAHASLLCPQNESASTLLNHIYSLREHVQSYIDGYETLTPYTSHSAASRLCEAVQTLIGKPIRSPAPER